MADRPRLSLVEGGQGPREIAIGGRTVVVAPEDQPPFSVEAIVEEEDRHLVLSAPPIVPEKKDHPIRVMTDLWNDAPRALGSVIARGRDPIRLLAVVHDLDRDPSVEIGSIERALDATFDALAKLGVRSLKLPLLGAVHRAIDPKTSASCIGARLRAHPVGALERVWIVVLSDTSEVIAALGADD
jgi:hypothetical protein